MTDEKDNDNQNLVDKLIAVLLRLPWADVLGDALEAVYRAIQGRSYRGLHEVLEYESTLELGDCEGKTATFRKREKVRYLQDNVIAYQDQAWGDGEILLDYRCTPGTPVDRYRSGYKTYILISRREVKDKGDVDEFNIEWDIREGFLQQAEQWETHVTHRTKHLKINVIFPRTRPPRHPVLIEGNRQRSHDLGKRAQVLPDGRWRVSWETDRPRLYENYLLQWEW
ncbi:MAG: hypothetical protein U9R72_03975 [Chloroflexota bacterium]|nr:hypothetical protein [Chloroflexota bacterium]